MKKIASIIEKFDMSINEIENSTINENEKLESLIKIAQDYLNECRLELRYRKFSSIEKEINFFKYQKPIINGHLKFYVCKLNYITSKPTVSEKQQEAFIHKKLKSLESRKKKNMNFFSYYKRGSTRLDEKYFLRGADQLDLFNISFDLDRDPQFSTSHDVKASEIICYDLITNYFKEELSLLKKEKIVVEEVKPQVLTDISWTASNTDLAEGLFALVEVGAINNGNVDMSKIVEVCKNNFGIDLGNIYNTFTQIKNRKKDPTKFIDKLKIALLKKIDEDFKKQ